MSSNTQSTVATSERFTINRLADETGSSLRRFALVIDEVFTVTLVENGPDVLVIEDITADENAAAQHHDGPFLSIADEITIPGSAIDLLEAETGMTFEGSTRVRNPVAANDSEDNNDDEFTLVDAM